MILVWDVSTAGEDDHDPGYGLAPLPAAWRAHPAGTTNTPHLQANREDTT